MEDKGNNKRKLPAADSTQQNSCTDEIKEIVEDDLIEANEVEAAEKVINAMLYYEKYALTKLKRRADSIKLVIFVYFLIFCLYCQSTARRGSKANGYSQHGLYA